MPADAPETAPATTDVHEETGAPKSELSDLMPGPVQFVPIANTIRELRTFRDALAVLPMPVVRLLVGAYARIEGMPTFGVGQDATVDGNTYNVTHDAQTIRLTVTYGTQEATLLGRQAEQANLEIARLTKLVRAKELELAEQERVEADAKRDLNLSGLRDTIAELWATVDHYKGIADGAKTETPTFTFFFSDFTEEPYSIPSDHYLIVVDEDTDDDEDGD